MTAWLVVVVLLLPAPPGPGPQQPLQAELYREVIAASSLAMCERHAERLAQAERQRHARELARTRGRISGLCTQIQPEGTS